MAKLYARYLLAATVIILSGCKPPKPKTAIVKFAEKAGAGELAPASQASMRDWLAKHRDVAIQVEDRCKPVRSEAPAAWGESTEGRLCRASQELSLFRSGPAKSDGRAFRPGAR